MDKYSQLVCLNCKEELSWNSHASVCNQCGEQFYYKENIPVFTKQERYWCNVEPQKMAELIHDAEESQDWQGALMRHIPQYATAVLPFYRADAQFFFPIDKNAIVLDAGSMWGGLTIPIAQFCKKVYAVDSTWETLRFLNVRAKQSGFHNVITVVSNLQRLPFPDGFFDFVVVNGVLEWLGMDEHTILEQHWRGKYHKSTVYNLSPKDMQLSALKELQRVTKAGGGIYIAIENRLGLQYLLGHPDDHMNVRFVTFLPRWLANVIVKKYRGMPYRTYIYSPQALRSLLKQADFKTEETYSIYPHYGKMSRIFPFSIFGHFKSVSTTGYWSGKIYLFALVWQLFPAILGKLVSPSIAILASKKGFQRPQRLLGLITKTLNDFDIEQHQLILANNRFENANTTNYLIYEKNTNKIVYFCKIGRIQADPLLQNESAILKKIDELFINTPLQHTIPSFVASIEEDGIIVQITRYVYAKPLHDGLLNRFRQIGKLIPHKLGSAMLEWPLYVIRKWWLRSVNDPIHQAIRWLADFQQLTRENDKHFSRHEQEWRDKVLLGLQQNGFLDSRLQKKIEHLFSLVSQFKVNLFFAREHGDFDICNILLKANKNICITDFEHSQPTCLPFFDLGNLIFNPLITEWKIYGKTESLPHYASRSGWLRYINNWISHYAMASQIPMTLLKHLPLLSSLEQHAKIYPPGRDPYSYPMYGKSSLMAMSEWVLDDARV